MIAARPDLPDARLVADSVKNWAAADAGLAGLLASGVPADRALARWSIALLRGNQITLAREALRVALALTPNDPLLWTNYGAVLNQANSPEESAASLEYSLSLLRRQPETWVCLGMVRKKLGDPAAAEVAYRTALELDPNSIPAWELLGLLKQEQRDFAEAAACLSACVKAGGLDAALFANLGKLYYQLGRIPEAFDAYAKAAELNSTNPLYRRMARKSGFLRALIKGETVDTAMEGFRNSGAPAESVTEHESKNLLSSAFSHLSGLGHIEAAWRVGKKQLELSPADLSTTYLLKAIAGDTELKRSPPEYVVEYFDAFAGGFEAQLVDALGYDVPGKICSALRDLKVAGTHFDTLDAGCGTGLCGPFLRSMSRRLTGVDLSSGMLEQARKKGIYDELFCEELIAFLRRSSQQFDLVVAADLMIYFGDLAPLISGAAAALRPGGLLACSTEFWAGQGYRVQPSGRFAHSPAYVREAARAAFVEFFNLETTIRLDVGRRLPGNIFVFRRLPIS